MNKNESNSGGGAKLGFVSVLTIVFITLKLIGKITWSWLWVLSPIWISIAFWAVLAVIFTIIDVRLKMKKRKK